MNIRLGGLA